MIRHIVLFKLKNGVERHDPRVEHAINLIEQLPVEIDTVESAEMGWDFSRKKHSFDYATLWLFKDQEGLDIYSKHPAHIAVLGATKDIFEGMIADFSGVSLHSGESHGND